MQLYLAATPEQLSTALACTNHIVHILCRIGPENTLLARPLPPQLRGGLLALSDRDAPPLTHPEQLCRKLQNFCLRRHFAGIVLDFEQSPRPDLAALATQLDTCLRQMHRKLYVPVSYARYARYSTFLLCTALSGGRLTERLTEAAEQYGSAHLALDLQRSAMDFPLPCPSGEGTALTIPELQQRIHGRCIYFSDALCARYCTMTQSSGTRFVLFDDADTLRRKMALAEQAGIQEGFFMLPEVEDLLGQLFPEKKKEAEPTSGSASEETD